jgi:hypothetical protein
MISTKAPATAGLLSAGCTSKLRAFDLARLQSARIRCGRSLWR